MTGITDHIMKRIRAHGRGKKVYVPKDFLDLGSRAAVDQALSRLAKVGTLRRAGRGLYDWPRHSTVLDTAAPASVDAVVDAVQRRANIKVVPGNLAAANALGLTHAVPVRSDYIASRKINNLRVGGRTLTFHPAGVVLGPWLDSPAAPLVQALVWLHRNSSVDFDGAVTTLCKHAPDVAKAALARDINWLPGWAIPAAYRICGNRAI